MKTLRSLLAVALCCAFASGCSAKPDPVDLAWASGCSAVDAGIQVDGLQRRAQIEILDDIVNASDLPRDQRRWARSGISLLRYRDVRSAPESVKKAVGSPCRSHGHAIEILG